MGCTPCADDPRVRRTRACVHQAALDLLAEVGFAGLSIESVAARAEVARTTIYRNWSSKAELVIDAFGSLSETHEQEPTGDLRADLVSLISRLADDLPEARWASVMASLVAAAEHDPELAIEKKKLMLERQRPLRSLLESGVASGAIDPAYDSETVISLLAGPLFYRRLMTDEHLDAAFAERIVDGVLRGISPQH